MVDVDEAVGKALALLLETVGLDLRSFASPATFLKQATSLMPGSLFLDVEKTSRNRSNCVGLCWHGWSGRRYGEILWC